MADNYLENRFEALEHRTTKIIRKSGPSLDSLLTRNRSTRGFSHGRIVTMNELREIIAVNTRIASSKNQQALRFMPVVAGRYADLVNANIKMGALFKVQRARLGETADTADCPELPYEGTEPQAFVLVYGIHAEDANLDIDLGISLQSMSLKAVELGLNCLIIRAFNKNAIASMTSSGLVPLAVLAIGKSSEKIFLVPTDGKKANSGNPEGSPVEYFRKEGIHYVPKLELDEILL